MIKVKNFSYEKLDVFYEYQLKQETNEPIINKNNQRAKNRLNGFTTCFNK